MRRQKKALRFFLALALFLFMFSGLARAEEAVEEPYALEDFNMEEIQRFLDSLDRDQTGGLSFGSVMKEIMDGNLGGVLGELAGRIREGFFLRSGPTPGSWDRSSCWHSLEPFFRVFPIFSGRAMCRKRAFTWYTF